MKTVVVIGASSGLGYHIAQIYINRGWRVGVAARRTDRLNELVMQAPDRVAAQCLDVTADDAADTLEKFIRQLSPVDIVVNCAGTGYANPDLDPTRDNITVATNCVGFTTVADTVFRHFAASGRKGQFAAITSVASTRGLGVAASYSASKRFQREYLTALDQLAHMQRLPIAITDLRPGFAATDLLDKDTRYPMLMCPERVARAAVKAIDRRRHVKTINRRWAVVVALWKLIPRWLWRHLPIKTK